MIDFYTGQLATNYGHQIHTAHVSQATAMHCVNENAAARPANQVVNNKHVELSANKEPVLHTEMCILVCNAANNQRACPSAQ